MDEHVDLSPNELLAQATCAVTENGRVIGTAWLFSEEGHLLTAGHLFGTDTPRFTSAVEVQFLEDVPQRVSLIYWGCQQQMGIDFAILKMTSPLTNRRPLPMSLTREIEGTFIARGYGVSLQNQSVGTGYFLGTFNPQDSPDNFLFQLNSSELGEIGYSGAAIFSDKSGTVVAIQIEATKARTGPGRDTILAMPLYRIAQLWEPLRLFIKPDTADEKLHGSKILDLLGSLDSEPLLQDVRDLYELARQKSVDPDKAIGYCQKALKTVETQASIALGDPGAFAYARGKFHLLIASICLDRQALKTAKEHYIKSQHEFHSRQWSHLESLAFLGLAVTCRELGNFEDAIAACTLAQDSVEHESVPRKINIADLKEAINKERRIIQQLLPPENLSPNKTISLPSESVKKYVFDIAVGERIVAKQATTDLNLLGIRDYFREYDRDSSKKKQYRPINLIDFPDAELASYYYLHIDKSMKTDSDLETETDILIRQENDPDELHGKKVAVLIIDHTEQGDEVWATLKTFFRADDHYFLNAEQKGAPSLIVSHYKSPRSNKIQKYYEEYEKSGPVLYKWVYDVRVSGEVVKAISRKDRNSAMEPFAQDAQSATTDLESPEALLPKLVRIPVLQDIAAGLGLILDNNVIEYLLLDEAHNNGANFGVTVVGDSMTGDGILPGDIALIHQQPSVTNGQIAAIVITTPKIETLGVIKRYYVVHQKRKELAHWLLESSNPASKHLVVIPSGCNSKAIRDFYAERIKAGKITNPVEFYDDAEIAIAGKYVGLIRKS